MRSRVRRIAWPAVALVVVFAVALHPPLRSRLVALSTVLEALGLRVPRPFAPGVEPMDTTVNGVGGRLYTPRPGLPAILIVPGATPAGTDDRRVDQVARALSRAGRQVFIPELDLYRERFTTSDLERITSAAIGLRSRSGKPVAVAGFSYGGSFALVASERPEAAGSVGRIAVMGAYFDLVGVVQAVTTGESLVGHESIAWEGHPLARDVLYSRVVGLLDEPDRAELVDALGGDRDASTLGPGSRATYELLTNEDPRRTYRLARRVPSELATVLETFSPAGIADRITVPVLAIHSTDDPLVPYGELHRMNQGMSLEGAMTVSLFRHVDFDRSSIREWGELVPDMVRVWTLATWLLDD